MISICISDALNNADWLSQRPCCMSEHRLKVMSKLEHGKICQSVCPCCTSRPLKSRAGRVIFASHAV